MRHVPNGQFRRELFGRKPMRQQPGARRKTHSLKPSVEHPEQAKRNHGRTETEAQVKQRGTNQPCGHKSASIGAVAEETVREFGDAVKHPVQSQK